MKCSIPEIAWHNRDPVLSVDFQPLQAQKDFARLATGGCDTHVVIWYVRTEETGNVSIEVAADLFHHQKAVNVVRWSPSGEFLASGDDESAIIIWKQKTDVDPPQLFEANDEQDRETWNVYKMLRGHVEDIYDLSWCPLGKFLVSGSVDNTAIVWDVHKGNRTGMLHHKGFVQGVAWDPSNQYAVTMSSDRVFRVFDVNSKKVVSRSSKAILSLPEAHPFHGQCVRLFHDDTLQSFFRRLDFSPDGELIAVPTGLLEGDQNKGLKNVNATYIYSRYSLQVPICILPCGESPALAVRWSPVVYSARKEGPPSLINLPTPARMILAVGTNDSISVYDTQQTTPLAIVLNPQYARLTDLTWSSDGNILIVSSSDGYCSIITFTSGELGEVLSSKESEKVTSLNAEVPMEVDADNKEEDPNKKTNDNTPNKHTEKKTTITPKHNKSPKVAAKKKTTDDSSDKESNSTAKDITESISTPGKSEDKLLKPPKCKSPRVKTNSAKKKGKLNESAEDKVSGVIPIDEAAMEAWSQDGFMSKFKTVKSPPVPSSHNSIIIDDPTQDMKLVYEDTDETDKGSKNNYITDKDISDGSTNKSEAINETKTSPNVGLVSSKGCILSPLPLQKTPRRVNFITLSSPKSKKKL